MQSALENHIRELNRFLTEEAKRLGVALPTGGLPNKDELSKALSSLVEKGLSMGLKDPRA